MQSKLGLLNKDLQSQILVLIPLLFEAGLNDPLVKALTTLGKVNPDLLPTLRKRLLLEITVVLGRLLNRINDDK